MRCAGNWRPRNPLPSGPRRLRRVIFPPTDQKPANEKPPPASLTVDQIRYALSQWFLSLRYGRRAGRMLLDDAAALIAYHRRHNNDAKLGHTRSKQRTLLQSGIDIERIRSCLESNFALYC